MKYCDTTTVTRVVPNAPRRAEDSPPYQSSQHIIAVQNWGLVLTEFHAFRDRRRATSFFMRRFVLVMGLMPFGHVVFSFRHGAFCRYTGRGSVPAARFVVARATRTLPLPSFYSHVDGV